MAISMPIHTKTYYVKGDSKPKDCTKKTFTLEQICEKSKKMRIWGSANFTIPSYCRWDNVEDKLRSCTNLQWYFFVVNHGCTFVVIKKPWGK